MTIKLEYCLNIFITNSEFPSHTLSQIDLLTWKINKISYFAIFSYLAFTMTSIYINAIAKLPYK